MFIRAYDGVLHQVSEESPVVVAGLSFLTKQLKDYAAKNKIQQGSN